VEPCNIKYNLLHLPENINYDKPRQYYPEHGGSENLWKSREHLLSPCLSRDYYVTEHGENNYYQKGFGAENPRMKHNNKFTMLLKKAYKILNSRPLSPVLRDDFSL